MGRIKSIKILMDIKMVPYPDFFTRKLHKAGLPVSGDFWQPGQCSKKGLDLTMPATLPILANQ